jgi:hypothetical protein
MIESSCPRYRLSAFIGVAAIVFLTRRSLILLPLRMTGVRTHNNTIASICHCSFALKAYLLFELKNPVSRRSETTTHRDRCLFNLKGLFAEALYAHCFEDQERR